MLVLSDLDGTLFVKGKGVSEKDTQAFQRLGELGATRVIATGRSVHGVLKNLEPSFPIDYLIFSSGAGILCWKTKKVLISRSLGAQDIRRIHRILAEKNLDFMVHQPIPENHHFLFSSSKMFNPDFQARVAWHADKCAELTERNFPVTASQFLVIDRLGTEEGLYSQLLAALAPEFSVHLATSPLDGQTHWIEIFPGSVSKALAAEWIQNLLSLPPEKTFALGNDYNDREMLAWVKNPLVVRDAIPELTQIYSTVGRHDEDPFTAAVLHWKLLP